MRPDMVFEIASVTKQFTAAAILLLQERGKLSVDDDITKYLPDYPTHGRKITIDHLLNHMSGIPEVTGLPEWWPRRREDLTLSQLIDLFKDKPLDFNPGEKQAYSNSGYILLGAILEKASGKSYEDFVEQEIFAPLGMKRSRYGHRDEVVPDGASGYDVGADGYQGRRIYQPDPAVRGGRPPVHGGRPGPLGRSPVQREAAEEGIAGADDHAGEAHFGRAHQLRVRTGDSEREWGHGSSSTAAAFLDSTRSFCAARISAWW